MKRTVLLAAVAAAVAVVGTAVAAFPQDNVKLYTGCLNSGGNITYVKEGDSPLQPCSSPKSVIKLSGGDITSLTVTAPLTGGGDNGALTIGLSESATLPSCTSSDAVPKWNATTGKWTCGTDNDTTYSAGAGLSLAGSTFSVASNYRVKNDPDCDTGKFATGFDSTGNIQCSSPPTNTLQTFVVDPSDTGLADNERDQVGFVSQPPAGTYFVAAKGVITSENNVDDGSSVTCFLHLRDANGAGVGGFDDVFGLSSDTLDAVDDVPFALDGLMTVAAGDSIYLECDVDNGADGVGIRAAHIVALKVA